MAQIDLMSEYVRERMEHWGREFALHRDCEYLGHKSKNMLQVLIEHKGYLPGRATGFKPLETDIKAQQIEDAVAEIARHTPAMAIALRGWYCGMGRRKAERWEQANELMAHAGLPVVSVASYVDLVRRGTERVHGMLLGMTRAA